MSLRDRLGINNNASPNRRKRLFETYGVLENPFPPASQTMGHPHLVMDADDFIDQQLLEFISDATTRTIVVEGTQGMGKTNLLEYYKRELGEIYSDDEGVYIVRYYADPEPDFGAVVRRIIQEINANHLAQVALELANRDSSERTTLLSEVQSMDLRRAFTIMARLNGDALFEASQFLLEYLMGLRIYKRHTESVGVQFRLDTTESKTQALHDLVFLSYKLNKFKALFLFLDELEKQGDQATALLSRYLSAIRALIDALPQHMFLILAMTPDARRRYGQMLPALSGRLQDVVRLQPLEKEEVALKLCKFYLDEKRLSDRLEIEATGWQPGSKAILNDERVKAVFNELLEDAPRAAVRGVIPRLFLDRLHREAELAISNRTQIA